MPATITPDAANSSGVRLPALYAGSIELDRYAVLGRGGEAQVYTVVGQPDLVGKVYRRPTRERGWKLCAMLANRPEDEDASHPSLAWPLDLLSAPGDDRIVGFLMRRAPGARSLLEYYNPKARREFCPGFHYRYLVRTARNLAATFRTIHSHGYVVGDVNQSNILLTEGALVTIVDTDSFQVPESRCGFRFRCPVGRPDFTPPELQGERFSEMDRVPAHDLFGLAVLLFMTLMEGTHPFTGVYSGEGDPPDFASRIAAGQFAYAPSTTAIRPMPAAPPLELLPPGLRSLFLRCFVDGHVDPAARPDPATWVEALQEAEAALVTCHANPLHLFGSHLAYCPWCKRTALLGGRDPFPKDPCVEDYRAAQASAV